MGHLGVPSMLSIRREQQCRRRTVGFGDDLESFGFTDAIDAHQPESMFQTQYRFKRSAPFWGGRSARNRLNRMNRLATLGPPDAAQSEPLRTLPQRGSLRGGLPASEINEPVVRNATMPPSGIAAFCG